MRPVILVIDDSKAVRLIAQKALAPFDCLVTEATNGFKGLFEMERLLPDLILLDVAMPTMNGDTMLGMMRSNDQLKDIPVVMITSPTDHKVLPKITALGVRAILHTPVTPEALGETVRSVVKRKPAS